MSLNSIAIIGGGLAGTSLAYAFSQYGVCCTVFESTTFGGGGASSISRGIVRVYDPDPWLMKQSLQGLKKWQQLNARFPGVFVNCGCLYLLEASQYEVAQRHFTQLSEAGYNAQLLTCSEDIKKYCPSLSGRSLAKDQWAIWEPEGGYVNTRLSCQLFAQWAQGALLLEGADVAAIEENTEHVSVSTQTQTIQFDAVILANGARLPELMAEHDTFCRSIPLSLMHHDRGNAPTHCLIDETISGYLRPEQKSWFYGGGAEQVDVEHPSQLDVMSDSVFDQNRQLATQMINEEAISVYAGLTGYDSYRTDFRPMLQTCSPNQRIGCFTAFSGRGAKYIPALAQDFVQECLQTATRPQHREEDFA